MNSILYLIMFNILFDFLADHTSIPITDKFIYLYTLDRLLNGSPISYSCASGVAPTLFPILIYPQKRHS